MIKKSTKQNASECEWGKRKNETKTVVCYWAVWGNHNDDNNRRDLLNGFSVWWQHRTACTAIKNLTEANDFCGKENRLWISGFLSIFLKKERIFYLNRMKPLNSERRKAVHQLFMNFVKQITSSTEFTVEHHLNWLRFSRTDSIGFGREPQPMA